MGNENEGRRGGGGGGSFFAGFILGAVVGGTVAYLISQEDARELLVGKAREAGNVAADATGDLRGKVSDFASTWQNSASDLYSRGRQVVDGARANINAAVEDARTASDTIRNEMSHNVPDA